MGTPDVAKKRTLPPWMTTRGSEPAAVTNLKAKRRKKTALERPETVYCMNEAELVDMALCILAEDCTDKEAEFTAPEVPKPQPVPTEPQQSTASSSKANISTIGSKLPNNLESSGCSEKIQSDREDNEDDDALKYVREIFFS